MQQAGSSTSTSTRIRQGAAADDRSKRGRRGRGGGGRSPIADVRKSFDGNPIAKHLRETDRRRRRDHLDVSTASRAAAKKQALSAGEHPWMVETAAGQAGACCNSAANRVSAHGYQLGRSENAAWQHTPHDISTAPGYAARGERGSGNDLQAASPALDGMRTTQLMGAHLVVIMGSRTGSDMERACERGALQARRPVSVEVYD